VHTSAVVKYGALESLKERDFSNFFARLPPMGELPALPSGGSLFESIGEKDRRLVELMLAHRPDDAGAHYVFKRFGAYFRFMKGSEKAIANTIISFMHLAFAWIELLDEDEQAAALESLNAYVLQGFGQWPEWQEYRKMTLCRYAVIGVSVCYQDMCQSTHDRLEDSLTFLPDFIIPSDERAALVLYLMAHYPIRIVGWLLALLVSVREDDARCMLLDVIHQKTNALGLTLYQSARVHDRTYSYSDDMDERTRAAIRFFSAISLITANKEAIDKACRSIGSERGARSLMSMLMLTPMDVLQVSNLPDKVKHIILPMM
jgi:hypothetical protein